MLAAAVLLVSRGSADEQPARAAKVEPPGPRQVMQNNVLMKLLIDPYYVELRRQVQVEPEKLAEWRSLYFATARVGESLNLLFFREGKDYMESDEWRQMTAESRDAAVAVGEAAARREFALVQTRYEKLIESCNDCHRRFEPDDPTPISAW